MKHTRQDLKIMQGWSLERKIRVTQTRILEWYMRYDGQVFISFSGGKDSTVRLIWHGGSTLIFLLCMLTRGWNTPNCAIS